MGRAYRARLGCSHQPGEGVDCILSPLGKDFNGEEILRKPLKTSEILAEYGLERRRNP